MSTVFLVIHPTNRPSMSLQVLIITIIIILLLPITLFKVTAAQTYTSVSSRGRCEMAQQFTLHLSWCSCVLASSPSLK